MHKVEVPLIDTCMRGETVILKGYNMQDLVLDSLFAL